MPGSRIKTYRVATRTVASSRSQDRKDCVEIAFLQHGDVAVRHSKRPDGGTLIYTPREWDAFVRGAKDGEFDLP